MNINMTGRHVEITDELRAHCEDRLRHALADFSRAMHRVFLPNKVVAFAGPATGDAAAPAMAAEKPMLDHRATAYVCRNRTCAVPVTATEAFLRTLQVCR